MEQLDSDVPLPKRIHTVGIIFNLKKGIASNAPDAEAEYDSIDTVNAIKRVLESHELKTVLLEADATLPTALLKSNIDIAFNIAEGGLGRCREAQVPALLDMLGVPFTGSDAVTLGLALDKALTKRILATYRVLTPKSAVLSPNERLRLSGLRYPVIVKPNAEGSSKGISDKSIVGSAPELRSLAKHDFTLYKSDMLAEEYIEGREFTVGLLGNGESVRVFEPMEIIYKKATQGSYHVYSYNVKQKYKEFVDYKCPSDIDKSIRDEMSAVSLKVFQKLGCRDFARVDFRVSPEGKVYFIEINPLPGLAPGYSDYPMLAEFCGVKYEDLVFSVLKAAAWRCGLSL